MSINNLDEFISEELSQRLGEEIKGNYFTDKMLSWLETLTINSVTSPKNISKLTNLKKLNILGQTQREYGDNIVIDYDELNELKNLEQLVIVNNYHIKNLDLSNLKNLECLILVANQNLEVIKGLDQLKHLKHVVIVGSNIKNKEWLESYISNTKKTKINILDYRLFNYIAKDKNLQSKLFETIGSCQTNLLFAEKIGIGEIFCYTYSMIDEIYTRANQIIKENISDSMSEEEKVRVLYNYVINHLDYDTEELEKRDNLILNDEKIIKVYKNKYKYINSSYRAFTVGKVVCEGYVSMLIYLLSQIGIEARNVYCIVKAFGKSIEGYYNHSAIKIKINGEWYYFDPQIEEKNQANKYFMQTKEEFSVTHDILVTTELQGKQKTKR